MRMEAVVERIKSRMKTVGIKSHAQLAKRCGVEQPQISRLLAGQVKTPSYMRELAAALETTVDWLLTGRADAAYGMQDGRRPYIPYPANIGQDARDAAADENHDLNALLHFYRMSTPQVRKDFLAIIRADLNKKATK